MRSPSPPHQRITIDDFRAARPCRRVTVLRRGAGFKRIPALHALLNNDKWRPVAELLKEGTEAFVDTDGNYCLAHDFYGNAKFDYDTFRRQWISDRVQRFIRASPRMPVAVETFSGPNSFERRVSTPRSLARVSAHRSHVNVIRFSPMIVPFVDTSAREEDEDIAT